MSRPQTTCAECDSVDLNIDMAETNDGCQHEVYTCNNCGFPDVRCDWFAGCERPATGYVPHPVLGNVSTCDKCHAFATSGQL